MLPFESKIQLRYARGPLFKYFCQNGNTWLLPFSQLVSGNVFHLVNPSLFIMLKLLRDETGATCLNKVWS